MRLYEILTEAKLTLFPGTVPFDQIKGTQIIGTEVAKVLTPLGTEIYPIGSSANPKPNKTSNDYDVQIDQAAVEQYFNVWRTCCQESIREVPAGQRV
jgi:hypothetical protein